MWGKVTQGKAIHKEAGPINMQMEVEVMKGGWEELKSKGEKKVKAQ